MSEQLVQVPGDPVDLRLWGQVGVFRGGRSLEFGTEKERGLLAALLVGRGQPMPRERVASWLWDEPPPSAHAELDKLMTRLRNRLRDIGLGDALVSHNRVCHLTVPDAWVDHRRFEMLVDRARAAERHKEFELLGDSLNISGGEALAGLQSQRASAHRREMAERRLLVQIRFAKAGIQLGLCRDLIPDLLRLFVDHPDHTDVVGLYMTALYLAGRRKEALEVFSHHHNAVREAGLEVTGQIRELQTRIMRDDETLGPPRTMSGTTEGSWTAERTTRDSLVVAVRFEAGEQEELSSLLGECLRVDNQYVSVVGDHVVCGLPPGNDPPEVLRSRMDSLAKMSKYRALVGIAFADEDLARSLASSDFSSRVLDAAREKKIVVTVSDELYHQVVIGSLPHDRRSYRRNEDEFGGWVRVPGYSMPPEPAVDKPTDHQRTEADPGRGPTVIVQGRARIGKQFNASVINYGGVRSDGR